MVEKEGQVPHQLRYITLGFPDDSVVKESTCQCRRHRFDPRSGKTPHAAKKLILCTTTTEPVLQNPGARTTEPMCNNY